MSEYAIEIKGLKKQYRLGQIGGGTLTGDLQSWWAKVRHKEDPNSKIGQDQRLIGQTFMALNGIDLKVKKGEALGIIGGNGAGKSTMLKILSRITAPTEGSVDIYGRITSMLEVGTGFSGEMTGRENVYMNGAILGMSKAEIDAKMEDIIEFSEVREFIDTPVKRYSSGMYVKLAFSVAAHLDSEIMIMDEVLAVGDMAFQKKCLDKMRDAATVEGKTVLYVSHNMNTIRKLCDRCIVLDQGKIIFDGDVEKAIEIYMQNTPDIRSYVDLANTERLAYLGDSLKCKIQWVRLVSHPDAVVRNREKLRIEMEWENYADIEDLRMRIHFRLNDRAVATAFLSEPISVKAGTRTYRCFEVDAGGLVEGVYQTTFVLFNTMYDISYDLDCARAIIFEKHVDGKDFIIWYNELWGAVRLENIKTLKDGD